MHNPMETNQRLKFVFATMIRFRNLWLIPAMVGVVVSYFYVTMFRAETWSARQSLIVRDDLLGQAYKPGQFSSLESMKSAQETILEVARKPQVIRSVLTELGPAKSGLLLTGNYPDDETIEMLQGKIGLSAPNGAEFGKTEVIILNTKASTPERSKRFIELLLNQIDLKLGEVRQQRLMSMELELTQARDGAALSLEQSTSKLREMENELGADIGAMQGLNSVQGNDGIRGELSQIRVEKRGTQKDLDAALAALKMLQAARSSPSKMLAIPGELLRSQPRLEALQRSLVDAQKAYADNSGRFAAQHPLIASSAETVAAMQNQIYLELDSLIHTVESNVAELKQRIVRLEDLANDENQKMVDLGALRVDHLTINAEVAKKTEFLNQMQTRLSEIQAMRMAAPQVHWLTRVDDPQVATRPDGLGKKSTILAGGFCGLMLGLGLVMLVAPPMEASPARSLHQQTEATREPSHPPRNSSSSDDTSSQAGQQEETVASPLTIPYLDSNSSNSNVRHQQERMQRSAKLRPVDIIRSADELSTSSPPSPNTIDAADGNRSAAANPVPKNSTQPGTASQATRSSVPPPSDSKPATLSEVSSAAERNLSATGTRIANASSATPDQLRNIAEAIANLGKLC